MKAKGECGHGFDVSEGVTRARCPQCGRDVSVKPVGDWLLSVDAEGLALEEEQTGTEAAAPTREAGPAKAQTPKKPAAGAADAQVPRRPGPTGAGRDASAGAPRQPEGAAAAEETAPPRGLIDLVKIVTSDPKASLPYLQDGIGSRRFLVELGVAIAALSLLVVFAQSWLTFPRHLPTALFVRNWLGVICEMAAAAVMLGLLSVLLKRAAKPLGIFQAVALVRIGSLVAVAPVVLVMAVIALATLGGRPPAWLPRVAVHLPKLYMLVVLCGQMFFVVSFLRLGCGLSALLNVLMVCATYAFAQTLTGAFKAQ